MINYFSTGIKGFIVGASMLVPGVSGGSMAMILGVYDRLILAISSFFNDIKNNTMILLVFCTGSVGGMILLANPILSVIDQFPMPSMYFFIGAVIGGIPMIAKKAEVKKIEISSILWVFLGYVIVTLLAMLPTGLIQTTDNRLMTLFVLVIAGFVAAIALILPGISVSYMFLILGIYDTTIKAVGKLDFMFLLPLIIGLLIGVVATTKILENFMKKAPRPTYLLILGFLLGSVVEIFPGLPNGIMIPVCFVLMSISALGIYKISSME